MTSEANLFTLPLELRVQIYSYLICCNANVTIRSLFIRERYQTIFMTQERKDVYTPLLRVCRQITEETLPILYKGPLWKCSCRFDGLASQIGHHNFSRIVKMKVEFDDLDTIMDSLMSDRYLQAPAQLCFDELEVLEATGFQMSALSFSGTKDGRLEAIRLCELAQRILLLHPKLKILAQQDTRYTGGSDAVDVTFGRVRWRFLADDRLVTSNEHVVDLPALIGQIQDDFDANPDMTGRRMSAYEFALKLKLKWNVD